MIDLDENEVMDDPVIKIDDPDQDDSAELDEFISDEDPQGDSPEEDRQPRAGGITRTELLLSRLYDNMKTQDLETLTSVVISANPVHTSGSTISNYMLEIFHKQGKNRMPNSFSTGLLEGADVEAALEGEEEAYGFNEQLMKSYNEVVGGFLSYLSNMDYSKDNAVNKKRKQRLLPAFIIYLLSSKIYTPLIANIDVLPFDYQQQVREAFQKIQDQKHEIVEEIAREFEKRGRDKLAEKIRYMGLSFFNREPNEIRGAAEFNDVGGLSPEDIEIYRTYRTKYISGSRSMTQDQASDLIEVVVSEDEGISERLKDKVRTEAIRDVREEFVRYAQETNVDNDILSRIILKDY